MDLDDEFVLNHLLLQERKCRSCGEIKNLLTDFYRTRRNRTTASAYSYECKDCTKKRVMKSRVEEPKDKSIYPDW
tara:strand:+ start:411 stop:635 length:225 start_codon:yes stop_codon:yes gene_type:complete